MQRVFPSFSLAAAVLVSGCSLVDDFNRFQVSDGSIGTSDGGTQPDAGSRDAGRPDAGPPDAGPPDAGPPDAGPPACTVGFISEGETVTNDTTTATDAFSGSCGGSGGNDVAYAFVAPRDDYYVFDTAGSTFDTVAYALDACMGGTELGCNNDPLSGGSQASLVQQLSAGETAIVVVDGNGGDSGSVTLSANAVQCPGTTITESMLPITSTTVSRSDDISSPCGGAGAPDRSFRYEAATAGVYRFTVTRTTPGWAPVISLERGPVCGGELVQCNASSLGVAEVTRYLEAGEVVTIGVDGKTASDSGGYRLDVTQPSDATCAPVDGGGSSSGQLHISDPHRFSGSCGEPYWVVGSTVPPSAAALHPNPDIEFATSVGAPPLPPCSTYCTFSVTADFPFTLSVQEGSTCGGDELTCTTATMSGSSFRGSVQLVGLRPDRYDAIIVLERELSDQDVSGITVPYGDNYTVDYSCTGVC